MAKKAGTNKTVFELEFNETTSDKIDEVFGVSQEVADKIEEKFIRWLAFEDHDSFTSAFAQFLESDVFKKIGWEPKTPNDYFVLGRCFSGALFTFRRKMGKGGAGDLLEHILSR